MISIVIPTFNEGKIIGQTLARLTTQLTLPHEIIVSDGGSTDNTATIARQYTNKVVVYHSEKRQTIAAGRNAGAAIAMGKVLVFLDADCHLPDPNHFFTQALGHFANPNLVALTAPLRVPANEANFPDNLVFGLLGFAFRVKNNWLGWGDAYGEFQMIRQSAFAAVGGFREYLVAGEDGDMFYRLSKIGQTYYDPRLTVFHTGRRAHAIGWGKLLLLWFSNTISVALFNKSSSREWTPIR